MCADFYFYIHILPCIFSKYSHFYACVLYYPMREKNLSMRAMRAF
nr:MAG TPA: hypothetical protein [Caudoviricetes sp.]